MPKFVVVTKEYQGQLVVTLDTIGIIKDTYINSGATTRNYGADGNLDVQDSGTQAQNIVMELKMPSEDDLPGFDELLAVDIGLSVTFTSSPNSRVMGVIKIDDDWDEGASGIPLEANWLDAKPAIPWKAGNGAIKSNESGVDTTEEVIDSERFSPVAGNWIFWDILREFDIGDKKTIVFFVLSKVTSGYCRFASRQDIIHPTQRPILRISYKSYPPEGFDGDDDLTISPYSNDPEQPILGWGAIKDSDFSQYKLYRDTSPISSVDGFKSSIIGVNTATETFTLAGDLTDSFPVDSTFKTTGRTGRNGRWTVVSSLFGGANTVITVAEDITDGTIDGYIHHGIATILDSAIREYVDESTLSDGTTYYYKLIAEDQDNHEDNALLSSSIFFVKPFPTSYTINPNGSQSVGVQVTSDIGSNNVKLKRIFTNWADGIESWYELAPENIGNPGVVYHFKHIYTNDSGGSITPQFRVESVDGFWSSLKNSVASIDVNDTSPLAKLLVNVKRDHVGVEVTLNAALSQPAGSNVTITKYEFKRYTGDSWHDSGTDPIYSFSTTGFSVGTKTAEVRITTSTALTDTETVDYELESGDPVELVFSRNTRIHEIPHDLTLEKNFRAPLEGDGVEFQFKTARRAERISVHGTTHTPDMATDIGIIRDVWDNDTYIRVRVKNEVEGKDVLYDGKIESDVTLGHSYPNLITWSFNMVVFNRTEV